MSVIGIDLGTSGAVMASVRGGKIQVLRNEISERFTPGIVSYTASGERIAGDVALNAINSNFKCTCRNMKVLVGRRATPDFLDQQKHYSLAPISAGSGGHVEYQLATTDHPITAVQAMASFLKTLSETAKTFLEAPTLGGVVLAVPSYYTKTRIQALSASAEIAKVYLLNCVKEYMAVAMDYGIYRRKQFDEIKPTVTAFVSVGHGHSWVTIAEFTQHYGKVLSTACNEDIGGRRLDDILIAIMAKKFKDSTGLDAENNVRARLKLESSAAKAKKTLSANKESTYNIECLLEGEDVAGVLYQDELVEIARPLTNALRDLCLQAISLLPESCQVSSVELVGNGSRAPVFISAVEEAFRLPTQRTLSSDETVARGCALYAALFSPTVRMKEYPLFDWMNPVPRKLRNPPAPEPEQSMASSLLKGFFNTTKKDEQPTAETDAPEGDSNGDTPMNSADTQEETIPNQTPEASPSSAAPEVIEPEEDLAPLPEPEEDPSVVADPLKPGHVRAFEEQEKVQAKKDIDALRRRNCINAYESAIFYCRDRARAAWVEEAGPNGAGVIEEVTRYLDSSEEWLWDHMEENFAVYEDKLEDLKHYIGQWFNDFKPKPKPAPEPEPVVESTPAPEAAPEAGSEAAPESAAQTNEAEFAE